MDKVYCVNSKSRFVEVGKWYYRTVFSNEIYCEEKLCSTIAFSREDFNSMFITVAEYRERVLKEILNG